MIWFLICLMGKKVNLIVNELFIRDKKPKISLDFITQSYFIVPKNIRLNYMHCFIMKVLNKWKLHQIAFNHSSDVEFQDFMNLFKNYTAKPYSLFVIDSTLASDNSSCFSKNILETI